MTRIWLMTFWVAGAAGALTHRCTRRAASAAAALGALTLPPAHAGGRVVAQRVGIEQKPLGELSFVWGGADRCDPTDAQCMQSGQTDAPPAAASAPPVITDQVVSDRVTIALSVQGGEDTGELNIGLWRAAAPESVDTYLALARGTYVSEAGESPAGYAGAGVVRVARDGLDFGGLKQQGGTTKLVAGVTKPVRVPCAPPTTVADVFGHVTATGSRNGVAHDRAGLLSVRRGGGSFEFTLTTHDAPDLDGDGLVIGALRDVASMEQLERLSKLPTNNYSGAPLAAVRIVELRVEPAPS